LVYAGLAALACAGAGSVARFSGRREEDQQVKNATA
jgi:hypothetical protein